MPAFALVDCNNFFVSCERVFRPELEGRPVIVLSNNDGCVISRSEEAKALGIGMGAPFFEVRALVAEHGVAWISANHELYVDMSKRVSSVLARHAPVVENYSIDESFLAFPADRTLEERARALRAEVRLWTGLPVSIGLAPTKALAKLGSDKAKRAGGVLSLLDAGAREAILDDTPVTHVWGIAQRSALRLAPHGIRTAGDLARARDALIRSVLGIGGLRLAHELRGTPCLTLAAAPTERQSVTVSRSFGKPVYGLEALKSALAAFAARAAERARRHGLRAGELSVHLGRRVDGRPVLEGTSARLPPTNDTPTLIRAAKALAEKLFVNGRAYKKAGVVLAGLEPADAAQNELFDDGSAGRSARLSRVVDRLNASLGAGAVRYGGENTSSAWGARCESRSPHWTTRWDELKTVRAAV
ncbi:MAG: Y-family DNA polymerase [Elusimicrobia bacterium]|nr:Y-family DNA polymerase [Elusimicrobiota bacterium]